MNVGRMQVSASALEQLLSLDEDMHILRIVPDESRPRSDMSHGMYEFFVTGARMPEVEEGAVVPMVQVMFRKELREDLPCYETKLVGVEKLP